MQPVTWDHKLTTNRFTAKIKQIIEERLAELDLKQISEYLQELNWGPCKGCTQQSCEKCPYPYIEARINVNVNKTLPATSLKRRIFELTFFSESGDNFQVEVLEGSEGHLLAISKEISF
jgi:Ribonuclease G/E